MSSAESPSGGGTSTGYGGPANGRWRRLQFDGDERNYEQWEMRFLGHMLMMGLKRTILPADENETTEDPVKQEMAFAQLIQFLDEKSLSLVMRDSVDNGRKALKILQEHYAGKSKPRVITLYTELASLSKQRNETVTEYIIRAEKIATSLRSAEASVDDQLLIALVLRGLPEEYSSFVVVTTQNETQQDFAKFKISLRNYEDTERSRSGGGNDRSLSVKTGGRGGSNNNNRGRGRNGGRGGHHGGRGGNRQQQQQQQQRVETRECYTCKQVGHISQDCPDKPTQWCKLCKTGAHSDKTCRYQKAATSFAKQMKEREEGSDDDSHNFSFFMAKDNEHDDEHGNVDKCMAMIVDSGATAHILTDESNFVSFDEKFKPQKHTVELADGTKTVNVAQKQGDAVVHLRNSEGNIVKTTLNDALYIPTYPENMFSVRSAALRGAKITFEHPGGVIKSPNGETFNIEEEGGLYYVYHLKDKPIDVPEKKPSITPRALSLKQWHAIMGHCNVADLKKLEGVVKGMKIQSKQNFDCDICVMGKMTQSFNRQPDEKATAPLAMVHSDLNGPNPVAVGGFRYVMNFVDDYSGAVFVYFLKFKSEAVRAFEKFLADTAPFGKVKHLHADNGGEYVSKDFEDVLIKNKIKWDSSAPDSPHQNGTAERAWRTMFGMARCLLIQAKVIPKNMWTYAVMATVYIRNRCFNPRTKQTPVFMLTGKVPDVSKLHIFGSRCFSYERKAKKLEARGKKGLFVGYDQSSPAYLVYDPASGKISKHRCVKFTESLEGKAVSFNPKVQSLTKPTPNVDEFDLFEDDDDEDLFCYPPVVDRPENADANVEGVEDEVEDPTIPDLEDTDEEWVYPEGVNNNETNDGSHPLDDSLNLLDQAAGGGGGARRKNPPRNRRAPSGLDEYVVGDQLDDYVDNDKIMFVRCYRASSEIVVPQTYKEAVSSPESESWKAAMDDEVNSLKENDTYDLVKLPADKKCIGGRWVYAVKSGPDNEDVFKARYVAKGFTQREGIDYSDTFAPTAKFTTIRVYMQLAVELDLVIHQMDVKTAYLNAPIDVELYMTQIKGYEEDIGVGGKVVCKLNRSLYGLKQSGRNWNQMLHKFFTSYKFTQAKCDACVYMQSRGSGVILVLIWVDDMVISASSLILMSKIKDLLKQTFRMKDMGEISWFLGIKFSRGAGYLTMNQSEYIRKKLKEFGMLNAKPRGTPCEVGDYKVVDSDDCDPSKYRNMVGSIIYAMTCTRPDLSWVVTKLSQHLNGPTAVDLVMVKHVFRYVGDNEL